jgi:aspartate/methionine/tyrosine aminotransferase
MERNVRLTTRAREIEPFYAVQIYREALEVAASGRATILCVGEPDFPTPRRVVRAAMEAVERGETHYTAALGIAPLRDALSRHYLARYGVPVPPSRIAVTCGASGALTLVFGVLANPGDEVLMADPTYPSNRAFLTYCGAQTCMIPVGPAEHFQLTPELVERHWGPRTIGVMLASPANPTGLCVADDTLRAIHAVVQRRGGVLIVDEIYHGLTYGTDPMTAAALGDDVFVVNSFSKYYCMTGWRLGWLVAPAACMDAIERLQGQLFICPPAPSQWAGLEALEPANRETFEANRVELQRRRDFIVPALRANGFEVASTPDGAFYVYANVSAYTADSWSFCRELLQATGIALTPGRDFGRHRAEEHVRLSFTQPIPVLQQAVQELERFARARQVPS